MASHSEPTINNIDLDIATNGVVYNVLAGLISVIILYYFTAGVLRVHFPEYSSRANRKKQRQDEGDDRFLRLPKKVFFVRHGESLGNIKESAYSSTADWRIPLTEKGKAQAYKAGAEIKEHAGNMPLLVYYSPYKRTRQTVEQILQSFSKDQILLLQEEARIREQDFGNFQDSTRMLHCKQERLKFGRFFYRFPSGESGADVYDRVSSFQESLFRVFHRERQTKDYNLLVVSHGLTIRIMLMRWFRWTVKEFDAIVNPRNAAPVIMEMNHISNTYVLEPKSWSMLQAYSKLSKHENDSDKDTDDEDSNSEYAPLLRRRHCRLRSRLSSSAADPKNNSA
eukprot:CAMPEP_0204831938 /NCGR_PEP_ID=MMETSP1346-20131115/12195_1 /ASSEMBLY_ACC=CAM_ASM_000771 /TAXON_ID=215587 /ORGANISM="Aplanochytrium stocchinoi, Strain GSBS06" /LENGTH=337 /DNA_ID=CAMNT_0051963401 /DNA_START=83 /DNA_END=1096 /DNA_ORIENTATION=-